MLNESPFADADSRAGARFAEDAGWRMPAQFGDPSAEYQHALSAAAVFDVSNRGKVFVSGREAAQFLHNLCTNEVVRMAPGAGCEAFLTDGRAKVVSFARIYRLPSTDEDRFWLDVDPGTAAAVAAHLDRHHISEQVEIIDRTSEFGRLHLAGPRAGDVVAKLLGGTDPPFVEHAHFIGTLGSIDGCEIRRSDSLGMPGYDLICPVAAAERVWEEVVAAGAAPAGWKAYDILRVEAGTPVYGKDIDDTNLPQEIGRTDRAISFTKGCYIGQETVARIRTYGHVNRSLVGLRVKGDQPVPAGTKLYRDGQEIGRVTSSVLSPRLGPIALAYVKRGLETPGSVVEMQTAGGESAEVAGLPFAASSVRPP